MDANPYISPSISNSYDILTLPLSEATTLSKGNKICSFVQEMFIKAARHLLLKICANPHEFLDSIVSLKDFLSFSRYSKKNFIGESLPFYKLISFLTNIMMKGSVQDGMDYFFKSFHGAKVFVRISAKNALSEARKRPHHRAFIGSNGNLVSFFYHYFPAENGKE
jgi:hypothetical protein